MTVEVEATPPFDFGKSLAFLDGFVPCTGDHQCGGRTLTAGGFADERPFVTQVRETERSSVDTPSLAVDVEWPDGRRDENAVVTWLRRFLSLDDDFTEFYATARDDPPFASVVDDLWGYHQARFPTPFEAACWAALSQRTPMRVARDRKDALVEACGRVVTVDSGSVACFPSPRSVLADPEAVEEAIGNERKAKTVLAAAETFDAEDLSTLTDDALAARLHEIWGFGPWSVEFVSIRGFGRMNRLPSRERRLREAVASLYDLGCGEASDADLRELSAPYDPFGGYWAHYVRVWAFRRDRE